MTTHTPEPQGPHAAAREKLRPLLQEAVDRSGTLCHEHGDAGTCAGRPLDRWCEPCLARAALAALDAASAQEPLRDAFPGAEASFDAQMWNQPAPAQEPQGKTCATCRHWDCPTDGTGSWCVRPKGVMEHMTAPGDFYCNQHEPTP